jgi:hypothetical protein
MTTDQQVRLLMSLLKEGKPLSTAAAKAGMSEPTARKYRNLKKLPSELRSPRTWRTREDPFAEVWPEVERMLEIDGGLEAKTVFEELERRYPGRFQPGQLRTLQRRFHRWRALHGPAKEVFFPQIREPGVQCQSDFTDMTALYITIAGEPFAHQLGVGDDRLLGDLRGTGRRAPGQPLGVGRGTARAPHGQPLGGHPQLEATAWTRL